MPEAAGRFAPAGAEQVSTDADPFGYFGGGPGGGPPPGWGESGGGGSSGVHGGMSPGKAPASQSSHTLLLVLVFAALLGGIVAAWWFVIKAPSGTGLAVGGTALHVIPPEGYKEVKDGDMEEIAGLMETLGNLAGGEVGMVMLQKDDATGLVAMYMQTDAAAMSGMRERFDAMPAQMQQAAGNIPVKVTPVQHALGSGQRMTMTVPAPGGVQSVDFLLIATPTTFIFVGGTATGTAPPPEFQQFYDSMTLAS